MAETDRISDLLTAEARGEIRGMNRVFELLEQGIPLAEAKKILEGNKKKNEE